MAISIYTTEETAWALGLPDDRRPKGNVVPIAGASEEAEEPLLKWGAGIFYFKGRKCLALCSFQTLFTLFFYDIRKMDIDNLGELIAASLDELYTDDGEMKDAILAMMGARPTVRYCRLDESNHDDSMMRRLLEGMREKLEEGHEGLSTFFEDGDLNTLTIEILFNFSSPMDLEIDGQEEHITLSDRFRRYVLRTYGEGDGQ